ncbi:transglycosylase SLT domain-containing protein [Desulfococcus sp.]|uniref:transglycosylase SLT domain-containing protein n=1 Tax=Desulfococcus sp. TaxID=2025834 RepID=UPI003D114900
MILIRRIKRFYFPGLCVLCLLGTSVTDLRADIYRYVDDSGVMHFTNVPTSERYEIFIKGDTESPPNDPSDAPSVSIESALTSDVQYAGVTSFSGTDIYDDYIAIAAQSYDIPFCLVKSIIKAESNFDCKAISIKGAQGLMQLMPDTAKLMNVSDPFDPYENIMGGTRYFRMLLNQFNGRVRHALAGYNAGPGNVERHNGIPPFRETRDYIGRVARFYRQLKWMEGFREEQAKETGQEDRDQDNHPVAVDPVRIEGKLTQLTHVN